jgi:hypothetical protein
MEDHDYATDVAPAFNSYNIVVSHRSEANLTDEQKAELARNERHLGLKMAIPAFVAELTAEQKGQIEALKITL